MKGKRYRTRGYNVIADEDSTQYEFQSGPGEKRESSIVGKDGTAGNEQGYDFIRPTCFKEQCVRKEGNPLPGTD